MTPHVLRHTFAVTAVQKGISLPALQRLLGHDHLATTEIYLNLSPEEVVREFRRMSPDTKIIAVTAQGSLEIALQAIEEGAFDFIAKPFDIDDLRTAILNLIGRPPSPLASI